ncbi:MAG: hypothetical protein KR126chlam1_00181 [Chlamydiae bacterium]|nr:hypothetical protein [Chlamydiota bacterium]
MYIVGLIGFSLPEQIVDWLREKQEHALVFIEEELGAFGAFQEEELYENPQIHFHFSQGDVIEELSQEFPLDRIGVFVGEGREFDALGLERRSAALSALYSDVLFSHKIVENVLTNYQRLPGSFAANRWEGAFEGVPAIICGAGPSLERAAPHLKELSDRALIFGGGSAITALTRKGIVPHFAMALDPNPEEFDRLKQSWFFEGPFLFAPRLNREVFACSNGPFGYVKTDTGGLTESWLEEVFGMTDRPIGPDMGEEAFSVTTLAISYAVALGCNPIILTGVDLAFTEGKRYASGIEAEDGEKEDPRALEKRLMVKDIYGNSVETLLKWIMEADAISAFAKETTKARFINASEGGIGFTGIENLSFARAIETYCLEQRDLKGRIHQQIQETPLSISEGDFAEHWEDLHVSLKKCIALNELILLELVKKRETGKLLIAQSDLLEEKAYHCFLEGIDLSLSRILPRYFPSIDLNEGKWKREKAKHQELLLHMKNFHEILSSLRKYPLPT